MKEIEHEGRIISIEGNMIEVEMTVSSACGSCKAKAVCGNGESAEKCVAVFSEVPEAYHVGENVMVRITSGMGLKAVALAYVIPFVILMGGLIAMLELGFGEVASGLTSLGAAGVYYLILYMMRNRIEREIIFKLRKI